MKRWMLGLLSLAASLGMSTLWAAEETGYGFKIGELNARIGADLRLRLDHYDRDALAVGDATKNAAFDDTPGDGRVDGSGPAIDYLRVRERVYGSFDLTRDGSTKLYLRMANRWQRYASRPGENNPGTNATWDWPDEWYFDNLYLDVKNVFDSNWSFRLGRQDFLGPNAIAFGNGMVLGDGTPYDQGRSIYFDGLVAQYETESDSLKLVALFNSFKDRLPVINDRNRRLRSGDTAIVGPYWTHRFAKPFNTDLYALYVDVDDNDAAVRDRVEKNHPMDENAIYALLGARVFGDLAEPVGYSAEWAHQIGQAHGEDEMSGDLIDARLMLRAPADTPLKPKLTFQYTSWSGEDPNSDEVEGWNWSMGDYPIFREELWPALFNTWTNVSQYRVQADVAFSPKWKLSGAYAMLYADHGECVTSPGSGQGDRYGDILSAWLTWNPHPRLGFTLEGAEFYPGDHWADGHSGEWLRFQTTVTF